MALFSQHSPSWNFPSNNYGQIFGIADSGVETFNGTPMKSLAREICQNSIDAKLNNNQPTRLEFVPFEIEPKDIPGFGDLKDAFKCAQDFWSLQKATKAKNFFHSAIATSQKQKITCLRISDFNTTGLTGSRAEYNSPWCNLTKSTGTSDKSSTNGGSFGIGKFAPYACSQFRTVFYSTADSEGICAYQGVARLTSFKNKKGDTTQGIGFYGSEKNTPVSDQISLDPTYKRDRENSGTDIFILGFNGEPEWEHKMVASILDGFLYAIYTGSLVVNVAGIEVSKETLPELMISHKPYFEEYADEYYTVLTSDEKLARTFVKEITNKGMSGKITLRLMIMPDMHRRVAMVRQTGMKIKNKGNINGLIPFIGLLYIEGDELNGYLRNLENPQHLEWEIERAENKSQARTLLNSFTKFIKACLDEMKNDDSEEALDPTVGEFLSAEPEDDKREVDKAETLTDTVKTIDVRQAPRNPKPSTIASGGTGTTEVDDPNGEIIVEDVPGEGGRDGDSTGGTGCGGGGHGDGDGDGVGNRPVEHRKTLSAVAPAKTRVVCADKTNGHYIVTFVPTADATNGVIELFMSAESQNYDARIVAVACDGQPGISFKANRISGLSFTENSAVRLYVQLDYHDYCSMEVKAYGNKI
jgi:hypothetical protein